MTIAFCLFKYFPYGGLQRNMVRIAQECQRRGCNVRIYTLSSDDVHFAIAFLFVLLW